MMRRQLLRLTSTQYRSLRSKFTGSIVPQVAIPDIKLRNEPLLDYAEGSNERLELEAELKCTSTKVEEVPIMVGGKEIKTEVSMCQVMPFAFDNIIARFYYASAKIIEEAIQGATKYQKTWDSLPIEKRCCIWEKAADLMAGPYRQKLNAAAMLGQGKTLIQAEIDTAELIDFIRMNPYYYVDLLKYKPISPDPNVTQNHIRHRGIDGFVAAITPFNFTAIGGNLAYTPALAGNCTLWKPSDTAMLSNWTIFKIMLEAGLPPEVVSFVPSIGKIFGDTITASPDLAGISFTGSTTTFKHLWQQVGANINKYVNFPVMVGECGGKNFHFVHQSADVKTVIACTIRSAFEYSGQKCSACSRLFVPESLWDCIKCNLVEKIRNLKIGDPTDFTTFTSAVIDHRSYERITKLLECAKSNKNFEIICGGTFCHSKGYFIEPTIIQVKDPKESIMCEEIFGPVLAVYVYPDSKLEEVMQLVNSSTPFSLTGSVFARDEDFLKRALEDFKMAAGNFYINDKSTGSVVGQQPFGGRRMSGTNDKCGGPYFVLRWTNLQSIKETYTPQRDILYSYMQACPQKACSPLKPEGLSKPACAPKQEKVSKTETSVKKEPLPIDPKKKN